ncbi:MAG: hypothetical protein V7742_15470 [Halioglobus sp.]
MSFEDLISEEPFSYLATKSGLVQISHHGKIVTKLSGKNALRFLIKVEAGDSSDAQLVMAKATGHFKHGSEKVSKARRDSS